MSRPTAEQVIEALGLEPHTGEGGHFTETYRCDETVAASALPDRYGARRSLSTAIYYLITPGGFSAIHRLRSDEVFHFYLGDPVEMLLLHPDGTGEVVPLGPDLTSGQCPQVLVPRGVWQGSRLLEGGAWALLGTTISPGFETEDFEAGRRAELLERYPRYRDRIVALTRR